MWLRQEYQKIGILVSGIWILDVLIIFLIIRNMDPFMFCITAYAKLRILLRLAEFVTLYKRLLLGVISY